MGLVKGNSKEQKLSHWKGPERLSKEMNTNTVSQNPKPIPSKNCKKTKHKLASPRDKEVNVTISKKDEPSMGRQLRFHLTLPKSGAQKMQNSHNFRC